MDSKEKWEVNGQCREIRLNAWQMDSKGYYRKISFKMGTYMLIGKICVRREQIDVDSESQLN